MAKLFLTDIDLNGNQLLKAILENVATNPASAPLAKGRIAFNTTGNVPLVYDGTAWKNIQYELSGTQTAHNHAITLSGDVTGTGLTGTSIALTLANSGVTAGTYKSVTVNAKGLVTAGTNPTTLAGYGITDAYTKSQIDASLLLKLDKSIFDELFEKDTTTIPGTTLIKAKYSFYSDGEVSAYGAGTGGGGGGSSYSRLDTWADYTADKSTWVLSALLGNDLNTRVLSLESGSATSITITGTGNAITNLSKSGTVITADKGLTFAELDVNGKVLASQLPSYVDDVIESASLTALNALPAADKMSGKIYVTLDDLKTYRWSGTAFVVISETLAIGTLATTAFRGDYGQLAYTHAVTNKGSAFASGLYKITTNAEGHVTGATAVVKADITALGIPAQDTVYTHPTGDGNLHVPATSTTSDGKFLRAGATAGAISWQLLTASDIPVLDASKVTTGTFATARIPAIPVAQGGTGYTSSVDGFARKKTGTLATSATSYTIAHGLGNKYCVVQVKQISDGAVVECDIKVDATNVTLMFNVAPAINIYEYTIVG